MGLWADTIGDGNSFTESVANVFTPSDGASYVGGTLTYDSGDNAGQVVQQNSSGGFGSDDDGNSIYTGSMNSINTNSDNISGNTNNNFVPTGSAPSTIASILGFASPVTAVATVAGKLMGWVNGLDPEADIKNGSVIGGRQIYTKAGEGGMSYSYNVLGQPYEVEIIDGKVVDKLTQDENGNYPGTDEYDQSTTRYASMAQDLRDQGNDDQADALLAEAEDNAATEPPSNIETNSDDIIEMAKAAGVVSSQEDMEAIIADPNKFLADRNLTVSDLLPTVDADATGTSLDPNNPNYSLGDNEGYTATTTGDAATVADVVQPDTATYDAEMVKLTDNEMVNAVTGTVSDEALVDADELITDLEGAATGVNADGTRSVLGESLTDFATQNISSVIDTSTVSGKLLAQKLGEGNYTDSKATVLGQMKIISDEFKDSNGDPIIPPWAQSMYRDASKSVAFNGISGTAATAAFANAIMEATLGVAEKDATFFQTLTVANLDNRQQAIINKANVLAQLEMNNVDVKTQAAIQNAKHFMDMDLQNLTNEQQAEVINKAAFVQALFDNTAAINAQKVFGAESENEMNRFFSELAVTVQRHNTSERNALKKFNAGEINDATQFTADLKNDRQKFVSDQQYNIDKYTADWRQKVELANNVNEVDAHIADVKSALDLTTEAQNRVWDNADNLLDYIWKTTDGDKDKELRLLIAQMNAQAGQSSGGGFFEGLIQLGGAFLGSSSGSAWLQKTLSSDIRLKENIQHYDTHKGINFYTWDWNDEGKRIGADLYPPIGVIAQEVQKTHPEAVIMGQDGYFKVNYGVISNDI
jgi:hypothetical protein